MAKVIVVNYVPLDGVTQAPARPDEDTRDGFPHGDWATGGVIATYESERRQLADPGLGDRDA